VGAVRQLAETLLSVDLDVHMGFKTTETATAASRRGRRPGQKRGDGDHVVT
jgi:hypothetical protein